jgi:hypothetical protein
LPFLNFVGDVDERDLQHLIVRVDKHILRVDVAMVELVLVEELKQLEYLKCYLIFVFKKMG